MVCLCEKITIIEWVRLKQVITLVRNNGLLWFGVIRWNLRLKYVYKVRIFLFHFLRNENVCHICGVMYCVVRFDSELNSLRMDLSVACCVDIVSCFHQLQQPITLERSLRVIKLDRYYLTDCWHTWHVCCMKGAVTRHGLNSILYGLYMMLFKNNCSGTVADPGFANGGCPPPRKFF